MQTTVLRTTFAIRKHAKRYPLRQHITAFFAALFIIAMVTIGAYSVLQFRELSASAIPLVQRQHAGAALAFNEFGELQVLVVQPVARVDLGTGRG